MPPHSAAQNPEPVTLEEDDVMSAKHRKSQKIAWEFVIPIGFLQLVAPYGAYLMFTSASIWTTFFGFWYYHLAILGMTAGAHRLWSHHSFKPTLPLKIFLLIIQVISFQGPAISWARDHRVHHKHTDTDADPYNIKRGFFFAHIGWLFVTKHPAVAAKGRLLDFSDLYSDPYLVYQKKYYFHLVILIAFVLPIVAPMVFWGETFSNSFYVNAFRFILASHAGGSINSFAHYFGTKPYDRGITPVENFGVTLVTHGEGWHNYHHTFPWDYRAAELGRYNITVTTAFIALMGKLGLATDLKTTSEEMVRKRVLRTGDGTHGVWGWGDKDMPLEEKEGAVILNNNNL